MNASIFDRQMIHHFDHFDRISSDDSIDGHCRRMYDRNDVVVADCRSSDDDDSDSMNDSAVFD